jgi:hypothetical protein
MLLVGFEPMIPVSERAKAVHALNRVATVIGVNQTYIDNIYSSSTLIDRFSGLLPFRMNYEIIIHFIESWQDSLDCGSAHRKAATYIRKHIKKTKSVALVRQRIIPT